ncbi:MAG: hypothetical protein K5930_11365 [Treponemataceae bacterium]|nr:hypothetical protein [Treponemataceae bacterium]
MASHITGTTQEGSFEEWTEDGEEYNPLYFDCEIALRQYRMEADACGDIEFWFYRTYERSDAEDGWPVVYSDLDGKPHQLLVNLSRQRVGLLPFETGNWGHCTLRLNRDIRRNEKVWIGIWSIFYTTTFDILEKERPADTDYLWTYSLGTYRDDLEEPPPSQVPGEWLKNDWRPLALLPHYFVYSDVIPSQNYMRLVRDSLGISGPSGRCLRQLRKPVRQVLRMAGSTKAGRRLIRGGTERLAPGSSVARRRMVLLRMTAVIRGTGRMIKRCRLIKTIRDNLRAAEAGKTKRRLLKRVTAGVVTVDRRRTERILLKKVFAGVRAEDGRRFFRNLRKWISSFVRTKEAKRMRLSFLKGISSKLALSENRSVSWGFRKRIGAFLAVRDRTETWRDLLMGASSVVDAGERTETWRALLREKATGLHMTALLSAMKTLNCIVGEISRIMDRIAQGRSLVRLTGDLITFWERLSKRRFTNRLEVELWSPVTQELSLRSFIKDRSR